MSASSNRIQRVDILAKTWDGVVSKLESLYSKRSLVSGDNIRVVPAANPENFEKLLQAKEMKLSLPVIAVTIVNIDPDTQSYNANQFRRLGYPVQIGEDRVNWVVPKLSPIVATFQIMFVTDDNPTLIRMIDQWSSNQLWGFDVAFNEWKCRVQVVADRSMTMPNPTPNSAGADQFRMLATLRAKTYSGFVWYVPSIRMVELQAKFPTTPTLVEALANPESSGIEVFSVSYTAPPDQQPVFQPTE